MFTGLRFAAEPDAWATADAIGVPQAAPTRVGEHGEVQRWRIVQAAHESNFRFALADHQFTMIAYDGIALAAPETGAELVISPGQRVDVLVQAGAPGTYALAALPNDQGYPSPTGPFGTVVVAGEPMTTALPTHLTGRRAQQVFPLPSAPKTRSRSSSLT